MRLWCNGSHASLRSWCRDTCRFESDQSHHILRNSFVRANLQLELTSELVGRCKVRCFIFKDGL